MVRIAIRADASWEIGSGHVMRCLALAEALREKGARVFFLSRPLDGNLLEVIAARGFDVVVPNIACAADEAADAAACVDALAAPADWLVVDSYALGADWEDALRGKARRLLVIDDLADRPHRCDLLLDQNLHREAGARYGKLLPDSCRGLFGPRYALLHGQFAEERRRLRRRGEEVRRLLVFFGGSDVGNDTGRTLDAICALESPDLAVDVVVGAANRHAGELERRCRAAGFAFHQNVESLAALMAAADLAVGAGGITTWERCCLGLPTLAWAIADNQRQGLAQLAAASAVCVPDADSVAAPAGICRHLFALLHNPVWRARMGAAALDVCDGLGARRVADVMLRSDVKLRPAAAADRDAMLEWRNHPAVRRYAADAAPIAADAHRAWFEKAVADPDKVLLIGEDEAGRPIGVLRYDLSGVSARVSIYLVPVRLGEGWGGDLLAAGERWLRAARPAVVELTAQVQAENAASGRLFHGAGYVPQYSLFRKELTS